MTKTFLLSLALASTLSCCLADENQHIAVKVTDRTGALIPDAQVVAILKSGAYQNTFFKNGEFTCDPTQQCIKLYAAAPGCEASVMKYPGNRGLVTMLMKPSATKSSAIIRGRASLPGIDGDINPILDSSHRTYMYATRIGLLERGRPAPQPVKFMLNRPMDAESSTGNKFKIWVVDIAQEVSILEYTLPKK